MRATVRELLRTWALACCLHFAVIGCAAERGTIGAILGRQADGRLYLRQVPPELAAGKAGLREGDEILLIDGRDVRTLDERQVHHALSGEVGQPVKLTLQRGTGVLRVTLKRSAVPRRRGPASPADSAGDQKPPSD